jgi:hypothetical protein
MFMYGMRLLGVRLRLLFGLRLRGRFFEDLVPPIGFTLRVFICLGGILFMK